MSADDEPSNPPPPRADVKQRLAFAAVRAAVAAARILPRPLAAFAATVLGRAAYALLPKYRRRMRKQIAMAMGLEPKAARRVARGVYPSLARMALESARLLDAPADAVEACFAPDDDRAMLDRAVREARRGVILVTGHLGNWEVAGALCGIRGWTAGSVAKPLRNPLLDAWLLDKRRAAGQAIWQKKGALRPVMRALRDRRGVAFVADQDGGPHGLFVPFFGRYASTMAAPAELAVRMGSPVVVAAVLRDGAFGRFRLRAFPPIGADPSNDPAYERRRLAADINQRLEALIREAPDQWLWTHRRWRTEPPRLPAAFADTDEAEAVPDPLSSPER